MRKDIPKEGTILFRVRENMTLGSHSINPPPGYSSCQYVIVESEVTGPYDWRSSGAGFRCVENKCGSVSYWKMSDIGKRIFTEYSDCVNYADSLADQYDKSAINVRSGRTPTYRPWRDNDDK